MVAPVLAVAVALAAMTAGAVYAVPDAGAVNVIAAGAVVGALGAGEDVDAAGRTSQITRLYRSLVGAVSLMVVDVPDAAIAETVRCTQYVSPTGGRY